MRILELYSFIVILHLVGCGGLKSKTTSYTEFGIANTILSDLDFTKDYNILSTEYGTQTTVEIKDDLRIMTTNALPNHSTGTFPNPGTPRKYLIIGI